MLHLPQRYPSGVQVAVIISISPCCSELFVPIFHLFKAGIASTNDEKYKYS